MEAKTTIRKMLTSNQFFVPNYQRAYSWDTDLDKVKSSKQVNTFLSDLEEHIYSLSLSKSTLKQPEYYFGHFIFEERPNNKYAVIDGQQRLTTIIIFLSALFRRLKEIRELKEDEELIYEDLIKRKSRYTFSTVEYDNQLLQDYVIDGIITNSENIKYETVSAQRIVNAYNFFKKVLKDKDEEYLLKMLETVKNATCTTHVVNNEAEAIQMFIFQNNRGKRPTNLEIVKAQLLFHIHLKAGDDKESIINEINTRFEKIYKSISKIEYRIHEDEILNYTLKVYYNSLWESNIFDRLETELSKESSLKFIRDFVFELSQSFEHLSLFFNEDQKKYFEIHSLIVLGGFGIVIPFILKAYKFTSKENIAKLCAAFEGLVLRHRLIGTRAELITRLNDVYASFNSNDISPILERIDFLKKVDLKEKWWWSYWNNQKLRDALQGKINPTTARFILWKYENFLRTKNNKGYKLLRFDDIESPQLEHIAPHKEPAIKPHGYDDYDEIFINQYIETLGNYLLISGKHNKSVGNKPFEEKLKDYNYLEQQREIQEMCKNSPIWNKEKINKRKEILIDFVINNF